jgi:hypothetical protein
MYTWDADYSADGAPENSRVVYNVIALTSRTCYLKQEKLLA